MKNTDKLLETAQTPFRWETSKIFIIHNTVKFKLFDVNQLLLIYRWIVN